jgi:Skp family chaperone for outer membrane proteins
MIAALRGVPLYIIAALLAALVTTGVLLRGAWQDEARAEALNSQWQTTFDGQQRAIQNMRADQAAADKLVQETEQARQIERERASGLSARLQEALRADSEYQTCRDVRLPADALDAIDRMRDPDATGAVDD